jgi:aminoglycoside phosphotransferase (APT) family kinase protein
VAARAVSDALPWRSERPLDAPRVARIVETQFPALRPASVAFLDEGWDSETYAVNGDWIVRFPKREDVVASQTLERTLLPALAPRLPLPIPHPTLLGAPCDEFPFPFLGYRRIEGRQMVDVPPDAVDLHAVAKSLSGFLSALHAVPAAEARAWGVPERPPKDPSLARDRHARVWEQVREDVPAALRARGDAFFAADPPRGGALPLRLVHADVTYDHVLLRPDGRDVAGVIDWGDVSVGDPAWDLAGLLAWFGEGFVRRVLAGYAVPADEGLLARTRANAVYASTAALWWGARGGRPRDVAAGLRGFDLALPAA